MDHDIKTLTREALDLPLTDRLKLVDSLLSSLDGADQDLVAAWGQEAEDRLDAYLRGEFSARIADDVLQRYLTK